MASSPFWIHIIFVLYISLNLPIVYIPTSTMRQHHGMQMGFVNMAETPEAQSVGRVKRTLPSCVCSDHIFKFTRKRTTIPAANIPLPEHPIVADQRVGDKLYSGVVFQRENILVFRTDTWTGVYTPTIHNVEAVICEPFHHRTHHITGAKMYLGCTHVHYEMPKPNLQPMLRACAEFPRVQHMYAEWYKQSLYLNIAIQDIVKHMQARVHHSVPYDPSTVNKFIRICAWEVQKLIMLGRADADSILSWLPKDICKLIHRAVFVIA